MLILHQYHMSPYNEKIQRMLNAKGVPFEEKYWRIADRGKVLKINPVGKLPALEHDGKVIADSTDIAYYIEATFSQPALIPSDPVLRGQVEADAAVGAGRAGAAGQGAEVLVEDVDLVLQRRRVEEPVALAVHDDVEHDRDVEHGARVVLGLRRVLPVAAVAGRERVPGLGLEGLALGGATARALGVQREGQGESRDGDGE